VNWHRNSDNTVAVSDRHFWLPIKTCPKNIKVLLLTNGGTAVLGQYNEEVGYEYWFPLPQKHRVADRFLKEHQERMDFLNQMKEE
jgi:hypothetical protein